MAARLTRRQALGGAAIGAAAIATSGRLNEAIAARKAPAQLQLSGKLTYWAGITLSETADTFIADSINTWGEANGVETNVELINVNDMNTRIAAAVESKTMPGAFDLGLDLLLLLSNQEGILAPVDDIFASIGAAQGGWFETYAKATDTTAIAGARTGIPYGSSGNLLFRRIDALADAGFNAAPATWDELVAQAVAVNAPPLYGLGLAVSNVGDGNLQMSVLQSFGGRIADDAGTTVTIKSEETRAYLTWIKNAWDQGIFPPGAATWDGQGDNQAYLSGQAAFIANTGSVANAAKTDDPELYEATGYSPLPAGPVLHISQTAPQNRAISANGNVDAAKSLLEALSAPEIMGEYFKNAIFGPVLKAQATLDAFNSDDPVKIGLRELAENGTPPASPDVYNTAYGDLSANFIIPKMIQRVVIDGYDFDRAMDEAQTQGQNIYDKYK
ncbi:MAG: ABC transporter substrate-binding protein [Thermomicrobiales bacterium]